MPLKKCVFCCAIKDLAEFSKDNRRPDGCGSICKKCASLKQSTRRAHNRVEGMPGETVRVMNQLGGKCVVCGESNKKMLEIDHVLGNGSEDRRANGRGPAWFNKVARIGAAEWPYELQLLCGNDHARKTANTSRGRRKNPDTRHGGKYYDALKFEVMSVYGIDGKACCVLCGESDIDTLELDHVNDDGAGHRKDTKSRGGVSTYSLLKRLGWPNDPQVRTLCRSHHLVVTRNRKAA